MERFTISLSESLARQFDELIHRKGYQNRSEAVRDLVRAELENFRLQQNEAPYCIASLSYVYNHHARDLAERLTNLQHEHHHVVLSTMHVHLDHDNCMETLILRGSTEQVSRFANQLMAEPEVRHGRLNLVPVDLDEHHDHRHTHDHTHAQGHVHSRPRT
ncbi:MAG: nickel-responsive transcriptional regulator NikR [Proteobacteria bacterium]|nr:MAG: nickel-responsive transcriptional regulator NikR [Pseudomonadota bacterium]